MFQDGWRFFRILFLPLNLLLVYSISVHFLLGDFIIAGIFWGMIYYYVPGLILTAFSEYIASKKKKNLILIPMLSFIYFWVNFGIITYIHRILANGRDPLRYTQDSYVFMISTASSFAVCHLLHYLFVYKFVYNKKEQIFYNI